MTDVIIALNAGSSSLKFSVFEAAQHPAMLLHGQIAPISSSPLFRVTDAQGAVVYEQPLNTAGPQGHEAAVDRLLSWLQTDGLNGRKVVAAGHRVVHGGVEFTRPVRIEPSVITALEALIPLAPLHQPHNLAAIAAVSRIAPALPQVACFDTAFHRTQPRIAQMYAIPRECFERGVLRYGFHGLSYEYIASCMQELDAPAAAGRTIVAHLGAGASLCAMSNRASIATTMGFTAMDGLVMGTRCGSIDPGVLLYLHKHAGLSMDEVQRLLYEQSGLLGVSGISGDMRTLLESDSPRAKEAIDLFVYRTAREIGSLAAALGGLDGLVFTGGIGEHAPAVREAICKACGWLGIDINPAANTAGSRRISSGQSPVSVWVIPTDEELMIARHTMRTLGLSRP